MQNEARTPDEILAPEGEEQFQAPAIDAITQAEIDIAIATAKRYPRNLKRFKDEVTSLATLDEETAAGCFFSIRRQGKTIQGESVRLAEIAISQYGNIRAGARVLGESPDGKFIRAMGVCHDLEKNVYVAIEAQRRITNKEGRKYSDDMIGVTANAAASIAFRNAAFRVIPKAFLRQAYLEAKKVATGNAKTLTEKRERIFERLASLNPLITLERILAAVEKPSQDDVTLDDLEHLIGLGTAIKDGVTTIEDAFPEVNEAEVKADDIASAAKKAKESKPAAEEKEEPAGDEAPAEEAKESTQASLTGSSFSAAQIKEMKRFAGLKSVSWGEVEAQYAGGPMEELVVDGKTPKAMEEEVVALIKKLATEQVG